MRQACNRGWHTLEAQETFKFRGVDIEVLKVHLEHKLFPGANYPRFVVFGVHQTSRGSVIGHGTRVIEAAECAHLPLHL